MNKNGLRGMSPKKTFHIAHPCPHCRTILYYWVTEGEGFYRMGDEGTSCSVEGECTRCRQAIPAVVLTHNGIITGIQCV